MTELVLPYNAARVSTLFDYLDARERRVPNATLTPIDYAVPSENLYAGTVTAATETTLTDSGAAWTANEWADKVVCVAVNGTCIFAVVASNTSDTLTFDDQVDEVIPTGVSFEILNTVVVTPEHMESILALDVTLGSVGVILPTVDSALERLRLHTYIERANNGFEAVIICRGAQRVFGHKYGTLEHLAEGARLYAHNWVAPHWDLIHVYNVKRYASGFFDGDHLVTSTTWQEAGTTLTMDTLKRFVPHVVGGNTRALYTSLVPNAFLCTFRATVRKTGGGGAGEVDITIGVLRYATGDIEIITTRAATSRFGTGDGVADLRFSIPVSLARRDEILH
jgi:hypothetical protein